MIPVQLKLSGFLSYRDPVLLDFTTFDVACISGENGAGKSSLLDAITWALFGLARKKDDAIINSLSPAAEVVLIFEYEGAVYRIQRTLPRGKTTVLEFQIRADNDEWKVLTERTTRDTQARIEEVLHLDYETFVNASFFLQGKADQFTQQKAGDRKRILASILGLDAWEDYKNRAAEKRKLVERDLDSVDGRIGEINDELNEEEQRKQHLADLETRLGELSRARKAQETTLEAVKQAVAAMNERRKSAERTGAQLQRSDAQLAALQKQLKDRESEMQSYTDIRARSIEVEAAHKEWLVLRRSLEKWESTAAEFREYEKKRQPFVDEINSEKARLQQELASLKQQEEFVCQQKVEITKIKEENETVKIRIAKNEKRLAQRDELKSKLESSRENLASRKAENDALKSRMDEVKARIDQIDTINSPACPLCGQPLTAKHRKSTVEQLKDEGKEMGDRWRSNKGEIDHLQKEIKALEAELHDFLTDDKDRLSLSAAQSRLTERLGILGKSVADWETSGIKRLKDITKLLDKELFSPDARKSLAALDKEYKKLGYDASIHENVRQAEASARSAEEDYRTLEKAQAAMIPLEREISGLKDQIDNLTGEIEQIRKDYQEVRSALDQAPTPDLDAAESDLFTMQEKENRLNQEVGAARQKVNVLDDLRERKKRFDIERETLASQIGNYKILERAFGKDGVPALLIEQALPEIETKANELLDRLSNGAMSVRFVTQKSFKDSKRDDLRETLEIQISDGAGLRDYEMFSGGEVFRVNFAVRLALSEILARRTGARLQTLVIDEGFGSQDAQGRQRLIEAINSVQKDFAKILVITHLEELKEAFPNRIVVEKTNRGSTLQVY